MHVKAHFGLHDTEERLRGLVEADAQAPKRPIARRSHADRPSIARLR
jgi:hypothetical protein